MGSKMCIYYARVLSENPLEEAKKKTTEHWVPLSIGWMDWQASSSKRDC